MSEAEREVAAERLAAGQRISVSGSSLSIDRGLDLVWGTDAYGLDYVAASGCDTTACLAAVNRAILLGIDTAPHPAEASW